MAAGNADGLTGTAARARTSRYVRTAPPSGVRASEERDVAVVGALQVALLPAGQFDGRVGDVGTAVHLDGAEGHLRVRVATGTGSAVGLAGMVSPIVMERAVRQNVRCVKKHVSRKVPAPADKPPTSDRQPRQESDVAIPALWPAETAVRRSAESVVKAA
ncbi:hypothetical protein AB0I69_35295 [Streptomyces sp. NPDC050508]|uniref:hypothetical protein n=1 Tax=Streptomyces sp. NPDC050508 TaxID=3155405 RepID=UPI00343DDDA5